MKQIIILFLFLTACSEKQNGTVERIIPVENINAYQPLTIPDMQIDADTKSECPAGMKLVEGDYCPNLKEECLKYSEKHKSVCLEFKNPTVCLSKNLRHMKFCMDEMERPNIKGQMPDVMISFNDLDKMCKKENKRLCADTEEIQACRGPENKPYVYGYLRDRYACNIDRPYIPWDQNKIAHRDWNEVNKTDQRVPSGSMEKCVSDYGVYDLAGNVDEFYLNTINNFKPYRSVMMGGHWVGGAHNECSRRTLAHNEDFFLYQASGRCCSDVK